MNVVNRILSFKISDFSFLSKINFNKVSNLFPKKLSRVLSKNPSLVITILAFGLIGSILIFKSFAATPFASLQPEDSTNKVGVTTGNDTNASGGRFVQFGTTITNNIPFRTEAENSTYVTHDAGTQVVGAPDKNYASGQAVLGYFGNQGQYATFTVCSATSGSFNIKLAYDAADGTSTHLDPLPRTMIINGGAGVALSFPRTSAGANAWGNIVSKDLGNRALNQGTNTIRFQIDTSSEGYWDVDYIEVTGGQDCGGGSPQCPTGATGTYPNCVCPNGQTWSPPNCVPNTQTCPTGATGTYPNCVCPNGFTWSPPNCVPNSGSGVAPSSRCSASALASAINVTSADQLSNAVNSSSPGQTILVRPGNYNISTWMQINGKNGSDSSWITICGDPSGRPVITGTNYSEDFVLNSSYIHIEHVEFSGGRGILARGSHHVTFYDDWSHDNWGCGLCSDNSNHVSIILSRVWGNSHSNPWQTSGISLFQNTNAGGGDNSDGYSNYVIGNMGWDNYIDPSLAGIDTNPNNGFGVTDGNCFILDTNSSLGGMGRSLFKNNICADNGGAGLIITNSRNIDFINNTLYHDVKTPYYSVSSDGDLSCNPWGETNLANGSRIINNVIVSRSDRQPYVEWGCPGLTLTGNVMLTGDASSVISGANNVVPNGNWTTTGQAAGKGAPWPVSP